MRVIGGELRGRKLFAPRGMLTRPTADKLREAVFNILAGEVAGARVLDLFAGTGALGIEALSRGAEVAVFIDNHSAALDAIRRNLAACRLEHQSRPYRGDIRRNLNVLKMQPLCFDLVFMDPPYDKGLIAPALHHLHQSQNLAPGARIIIEHSPKESPVPNPSSYRLADQRRYGKTWVTFLRFQEPIDTVPQL